MKRKTAKGVDGNRDSVTDNPTDGGGDAEEGSDALDPFDGVVVVIAPFPDR